MTQAEKDARAAVEFWETLVERDSIPLPVAITMAGQYTHGLAVRESRVTVREARPKEPWELPDED